MKYAEIIYWNTNTYGNAITLRRRYLHLAFLFVCLVTPFTNWLIPFAGKMIPKDIIFRY